MTWATGRTFLFSTSLGKEMGKVFRANLGAGREGIDSEESANGHEATNLRREWNSRPRRSSILLLQALIKILWLSPTSIRSHVGKDRKIPMFTWKVLTLMAPRELHFEHIQDRDRRERLDQLTCCQLLRVNRILGSADGQTAYELCRLPHWRDAGAPRVRDTE